MSDHQRKHPEREKGPDDSAGRIPISGPEEGNGMAAGEENAPSVTLSAQEYGALQAEVDELKDRYLRTAADFENFRKRTEKERENIVCYANEQLIGDLLPILDNLERALSTDRNGVNVESVLEGVHLVRKQLHSVLTACGLEPVHAVGEAFDPRIHEAVGVLPSENHDEGTVVSELQKGYRLRGKVLRHSVVHVAGQPGDDPNGKER